MRRSGIKHMGGLYWRLTASYVSVTLLAALIILCAMVLSPSIQQLSKMNVLPQQTLQKVTEIQVTPLLEKSAGDQTSLLYWGAIPTFDEIKKNGIPQVLLVSIFSRDGQVLVSTIHGRAEVLSVDSTSSFKIAKKMSSDLFAAGKGKAIIHDVLMNQQPYVGPVGGRPSRNGLVIPVLNQQQQAVGAVAAVFDGPFPGPKQVDFSDFLAVVSEHWQSSMFYFIILACAIGTIAGVLITRNLTRRLSRITQVASDWGKGNFETEVLDHSGDEVGQLTRDLNRMAKQLQVSLAARQSLAVLEERNRLARDLHDSVKQHVFSGALLVRAARKLLQRDPQTANQYLTEAEQIAERVHQELAQIIAAHRPTVLTNRGIVEVLREFVSDWSRRSGIDVDVSAESQCKLPIAAEEAVFRIAQEALTNVVRHSNATLVNVSLSSNDRSVCLRICDNGSGFDVEARLSEGVGLSSMRERVQALRGKLNMSSSSSGTRVEACVPLSDTNLNEWESNDE